MELVRQEHGAIPADQGHTIDPHGAQRVHDGVQVGLGERVAPGPEPGPGVANDPRIHDQCRGAVSRTMVWRGASQRS